MSYIMYDNLHDNLHDNNTLYNGTYVYLKEASSKENALGKLGLHFPTKSELTSINQQLRSYTYQPDFFYKVILEEDVYAPATNTHTSSFKDFLRSFVLGDKGILNSIPVVGDIASKLTKVYTSQQSQSIKEKVFIFVNSKDKTASITIPFVLFMKYARKNTKSNTQTQNFFKAFFGNENVDLTTGNLTVSDKIKDLINETDTKGITLLIPNITVDTKEQEEAEEDVEELTDDNPNNDDTPADDSSDSPDNTDTSETGNAQDTQDGNTSNTSTSGTFNDSSTTGSNVTGTETTKTLTMDDFSNAF